MEHDNCICKCHPVKEVCRVCCVRTAEQMAVATMLRHGAEEQKLQDEIDRLKAEKAESTVVTASLLDACKAAYGAFSSQSGVDWDGIGRAIRRAEGGTPEKKEETVSAAPSEVPHDPKMYNGKPKDQDACLRELGWAVLYMKYLHPDWLEHPNCKEQQRRVKILFRQVAVSWHRDEDWWWVQMFDEIMDEIENMC